MSNHTRDRVEGDGEYPRVPWIHMSDYESTDRNNPDRLQIKVESTEPFETDYGTSIGLLLLVGNNYEARNLTLKSVSSKNPRLQNLWDKNVKNGKIRKGTTFSLLTYKRKSKKSDNTVRDYWMLFS